MKLKKFKLLLVTLLCLFFAQAYSQDVKISGTILDDQGQPLPGANVFQKGTVNGTQTDFDGKFSLTVSDLNATLTISFIGFTTQEVLVNGQTNFTISLVASAAALDEVVVVGYGTQKKSDVTGAITSVSGKALNETSESNALNALAGKAAGVQISVTNNNPGSSPSILVRGRSSLNFSNEPLLVIDGIPLEGNLSDVNSSDIASIEVLKDASSAAIYGARGANGVILITTKRGKSGKPSFNYSTYYAISNPGEDFDLLNSEQWVAMRLEAVRAAKDQKQGVPVGTNPIPSIESALEPLQLQAFQAGVDTDFQGLAFQSGLQINHQLGVTGGTEKLRYALSANYFKQEGILGPAQFERYSFRTNLDFDLTKKLKIGISQQVGFGLRGDTDPISAIVQNSPLTPPFNEDGTPTTDPLSDGLVWNPLNNLDTDNKIDRTKNFRYFANIFASYKIFSDLKYTFSVQPQFETLRRTTFDGKLSAFGRGVRNKASKDISINTSFVIENVLDYKKVFNEVHSLDATFLYSFQNSERDFTTVGVSGLASDSQTFNNLSDGEVVDFRDSFLDTEDWTSFMARFNYAYKGKYLLTLTGRYDGSSKLSQGNKWGFFPSASVAWKISEEDFFKNQTLVSDLKLRFGYGQVGRNPISPFTSFGSLGRTEGSFGGNAAFGFTPLEIANPNLKWEKTKTFNVAIDFALMQNRISGSIDYYNNTTTDLLLNRLLPATSGFQSILQNIGETDGEGVDVTLSTIIINTGDFKWTTDFNYSVNSNTIVELSRGKLDDVGDQRFIGKPLSVFFDRVFDGIWQLDEVAEAASFGRRPGDIKLKDLNNDGVINDDDRRIIGQRDPKWTGGLTSKMEYKGFDLTVVVLTSQGNVTRSRLLQNANTLFGRFNNLNVNFWTPENPSNKFPRPNANQERPLDSQVLNFVDASFTRIRDITLGYTFKSNSKVANYLKLENLRLYATAQNPFLFTAEDLDGFDPEVGASSNFLPSPKTFLYGINVSF